MSPFISQTTDNLPHVQHLEFNYFCKYMEIFYSENVTIRNVCFVGKREKKWRDPYLRQVNKIRTLLNRICSWDFNNSQIVLNKTLLMAFRDYQEISLILESFLRHWKSRYDQIRGLVFGQNLPQMLSLSTILLSHCSINSYSNMYVHVHSTPSVTGFPKFCIGNRNRLFFPTLFAFSLEWQGNVGFRQRITRDTPLRIK